MLPLLLASSSTYRRDLLQRLHLPFDWASPDIDEGRLGDEPAEALVRRLAAAKARALAATHPAHLGCGVAARLLTAAERWAAVHGCVEVRLEVRADNAASLALFRKRGYVAFGRHAAYYHDGMDALRLRRTLAP